MIVGASESMRHVAAASDTVASSSDYYIIVIVSEAMRHVTAPRKGVCDGSKWGDLVRE